MRFDSISVVSVNAETGATTITGIPRDMPHFPFSAGPMQDLYPDGHEGHADPTCGWGSGINQLRTEVEVCQDGNALYPDAVANGSEPGHRGDEGRRGGDPRRRDPVLRVPRHARLRGARRRPRRRRHHGRGAAPRGRRTGLRGPARRGVGDRLDRGRAAAHGRRHRAVVRALALHDERLRPHEAPAGPAAGDPRPVHAADRADPIPGCRRRRRGHRRRPTCRSRSSRSSPTSR